MSEDNDNDASTAFEAMRAAKKAFEKSLDDAGLDAAYFSLKLEVRILGVDFGVMETLTSEDSNSSTGNEG